MKGLLISILILHGLFALNLEDAIKIALNQSDSLKEQDALKKQGIYLSKTKYASLMPIVDGGYTFSYNIPGSTRDYYLNSFNLRFSYNLFNGLQDYYKILDSKQDVKRLDYALNRVRTDVVLQTKNAYINALQSRVLLQILQERKKNIEIQKRKANEFVNQGIRAKNESLSMDILLSNTMISIKNTQLSLENYLKNLGQILKENIGVEDLEEININTTMQINEEEIFLQILEHNTQYLSLISLIDSAKLQYKIYRGNFLPKLDLSGVKYWYIDGSNVISTSYGLQSQIRINLTWNLFNGLSDGYKYQAARTYILSLQNKLEALKRNLRIELQGYIKRFTLAKEQFSISKSTLIKAEENYKITNNRYIQGLGTYTELIDAELLLNTARTNIAQAKYDIALVLAQIDYFMSKTY